ncbi:MMPL family transporter [bacterium]|nr:MMPL family transporter [bacterium]
MNPVFSDKYAAFLFKRKWWVLAITLVITIFFGAHANKVLTINALENMVPEHDADLVRYLEFNKEYGGDFIMMIALEAPEIFTSDMLQRINLLTNDLQKIPQVEEVTSLTNTLEIKSDDSELKFEPLADHIPSKPEDLERLKNDIRKNPLYTPYIVHPFQPITALYVRLKQSADVKAKQDARDAVVPVVKEIIKKHQALTPFTSHLAGSVTIEYQLDKSARENQVVMTAFMLAMISFVLYYLFRRVSAVLLTLFCIALSSIWTTGLIGFLKLPLNFVTSLLPPLVLMVAVLDCIHIYATFRAQDEDLPIGEKIKRILSHVLIPCLVTGLTTCMGFGALVTSDMSVIRHFGLFAAFGIASALFIALGPLPILLMFLPKVSDSQKEVKLVFLEKAVTFFMDLSRHHWKKNLVFSLVLVLFAFAGFFKIFIETRPPDFYPKNSEIPRDFDFVDEKFNGSTSSDMVIKGPSQIFTDPATLANLEKFLIGTESVTEASKPLSVIPYIKEVNRKIHDDDPHYYKIPDTKEEISQIYFLLEGNHNFRDLINLDYSSVRIHQQIKAVGTRLGKNVIDRANAIKEKYIKAPLEGHFTGANIVWMNMERYIVQSQIMGFACDFAITLLLIILLRSIKWGVLSMLPNIFPIIGTFGVMGWVGIPLNMLTTMIASIAIGLAVDDTVHLMMHIRHDTQHGKTMEEAIEVAFKETGPAVISTSLVLSLGFFTLCLTSFAPTRQFGFLGGITFLFALVGELVLLPALLRLLAPYLVKNKEFKLEVKDEVILERTI